MKKTRRKGNNKVISSIQNKFLVMESRKRNMYENSQKFNDRNKSRRKSRTKKYITCFHCNKPRLAILDKER